MKSIAHIFQSHSFANRLSWCLVITLFVIMGVAIYMIYQLSWAVLNTESVRRHNDFTSRTSEEIGNIVSDVRLATINNVANIEEHLDRPDQMHDILKRVVELNPNLQCIGVSFIADYYPQKGRWYAPYARRDSLGNVVTGYAGDSQHNYLHEPDYMKALTVKEGFWTKPYVDCVDLVTPLVSFMQPIHDRSGKVVGVITSDLSLSFLNDKLGEMEPRLNWWTGGARPDYPQVYTYSFIIDRDGVYVSHPDTARILKENYFDYAKKGTDTLAIHAGHLMLSGKLGSYLGEKDFDLQIEGTKAFLFYAPVAETGWALGIVVPELAFKFIGYGFVGILLFLIIIALLVVFFMSLFGIRHEVKPLKTLAKATEEVAQGKFDTPLPKIKRHDEIRLLRDSFEEMQLSLTQYIDQLQTTTAQKATMESELNIAHNIQMSMLPKTFPPYPQRSDVDIYGMLTPAKAVGGDLFDFYIRDEKLFFCVGDVSGKGVPASLVMAVTRSLFRNISAHTSEPDAIVRSINDAIVDNNDTGMFVTLFVGVLDLKTGCLLYCNGGHNPPLLISDKVAEMSCDSNLVVGIMPGYEFSAEETTISHGTTIFLFTDGLNEAEDANYAQFGDERIHSIAWSAITEHITSPADLVDHMNKAVHQFVGEAEQSDDLTMLAIRYY
jgi:sigma-B regulation protein RsbU (phosphoserine phosphatase)